MLLLYSIFIRLYEWAIWSITPFNGKANAWISGRKTQAIKGLPQADIWVHCASLGEYEQVRPILRGIRQEYPQKTICLSFFSSSGYLHVADTDDFNFKAYIPADSRKNAIAFLNHLNPELVIFVKNDFWYNHMDVLNKRQIPFMCISTTVRSNAFYLMAFANVFKNILKQAKCIFVQDEHALKTLEKAGFTAVKHSGDTRLDQVLKLAKEAFQDEIILSFKASKKLIILASTHPEDDKLYMPVIRDLANQAKILIAPHDIHENRIIQLEKQISLPAIRYSAIQHNATSDEQIMILDNIGLLSRLYRYADVVYVGGGFGKGIHNTLEPAAYGLPLCFGPNYGKFNEATYFIEHNIAICISDQHTLYNALIDGLDGKKTGHLKAAYLRYFKIFGGGSEKVIDFIKQNHLLT
jgi:3-deoxy-D-manno-octulosonic-acid transferase